MIPPVKIKKGLFFKKAVLSKIEEICGYLRQTRMIAGPGIRIRETAAGSVIESLKNENQNSKEGPSQSSDGEAELVYNSAFKAVLVTSEEGERTIKIIDPGDSTGQNAGQCGAIGWVPSFQIAAGNTAFDIFFIVYYDDSSGKYEYVFSTSSSVSGKTSIATRIASWDAENSKVIQQWWHGDIRLSYGYIL